MENTFDYNFINNAKCELGSANPGELYIAAYSSGHMLCISHGVYEALGYPAGVKIGFDIENRTIHVVGVDKIEDLETIAITPYMIERRFYRLVQGVRLKRKLLQIEFPYKAYGELQDDGSVIFEF